MWTRLGRLWMVCGFVLGLMLRIDWAAGADQCTMQSPTNCSTNRLEFTFQGVPAVVPNGGTVTYQVEIFNNPVDNPDACDIKAAFVTLCCPGADGDPAPGPAGCTLVPVAMSPCQVNGAGTCVPTQEAAQGINLPADGGNNKTVAGLECQIQVNPGVTTARAQAMVDAGYLLCMLPPPSTGVVQPAFVRVLGVNIVGSTPGPTTPTFTPAVTPTAGAAVPVVPAPTSPAGALLIGGLGLSALWMLRRRARTSRSD